MGGCCSKCGNYLLGPAPDRGEGDNPKLTKLNHKQSFSDTPINKVNGGINEGAGDTTPVNDNSRQDDEKAPKI